jgi:23S rRNA (adenine2030-N6)-methyltransferase
MNYRHAFHAGNFADVFKHAVLARILVHLCGKPTAFRVIDTHAGAGIYDLTGPEAERSPEWRSGIQRLLASPLAEPVRALLAPYLDVVAALNDTGALTRYPGSPALVRAHLRDHDRLMACEREPGAAAALAGCFSNDRRIRTLAADGWTALNAQVPPPERRGLVVVDPAFEEAGDFTRLAQGLETAHRKWSGGVFLLWYPVKGRRDSDALAARLRHSGIPKVLRAELAVAPTPAVGPLGGCGLVIVNPPWTLEAELAVLMPALVTILATDNGGYRLEWINGER